MFFPSTYPCSRRPCRNASVRAEMEEGEVALRKPIRGTFFDCCALAKETAVTKTAISTQIIFVFCIFSFASLDHLVRPREHVGRNRHADLLGRLEIDDELEFCRLLHGKIGWLGALEDLVDISCRTPGQVGEVCPIGHKTTIVHKF